MDANKRRTARSHATRRTWKKLGASSKDRKVSPLSRVPNPYQWSAWFHEEVMDLGHSKEQFKIYLQTLGIRRRIKEGKKKNRLRPLIWVTGALRCDIFLCDVDWRRPEEFLRFPAFRGWINWFFSFEVNGCTPWFVNQAKSNRTDLQVHANFHWLKHSSDHQIK